MIQVTINGKNYVLADPQRLASWQPPSRSGIYVVCGPPNLSGIHPVLYIGESENLAERGFPWGHEKASSWIRSAGGKDKLYISYMPIPNSTLFGRLDVERMFINHFNPPCNKQ